MSINKIAIVGISGSGKSTFSRELAGKTNLPLFHMDPLYWRGNWEAVPETEYLIEHQRLIDKPEWIIEGWVDKKMAGRVKMADLIIYLDYPGYLCAWRLIKRYFKHNKVARPELPREALEEFQLKYLWKVFWKKEKANIEKALVYAEPSRIMRIYSLKQLKKFLSDFQSNFQSKGPC